MAEASISVFQDQFSCSICLDLLKDPVTINCGHSFCMSCITDCWNQEDQKRVYSCPQCRQTFTPRPALGKNVILAEMVEKLKKTKLHTDGAAPSYAGPEDVECDVCTGRKHKAVKSCLVCLNSYCQTHFERHEELQSGKRHKVTEATGRLQEMICSQHDRLLEIFCRTDQTCICYLCTMDEHKNHDTVSAAAERTEKQKLLEDNQRKHQQRIEEKEKELQDLREAVKTHKRSAQTAVEDTERIFTELIRSVERRRSEVIKLIRDQEKTAVSQAEGLLKELEQEIEDLRRRNDEMEQLSHTEHHISFLQSFQSLSASSGSIDNIIISSLSFDDVGKSVINWKERSENVCKEEIGKISWKVSYIEIIPTNVPTTRAELIQYFRLFSLDLNTVNENICLSERNRVATYTDTKQQYPDHPERFDFWTQVLCRESVCGCCYWEVEWSGDDGVSISVSYKSLNRKGKKYDSAFRLNDQTWCLECSPSSYSFWHYGVKTDVTVPFSSSRIGVYVDHSAGILSFYSVSDTMILIHRVHTTFTQPLYPGFVLRRGSTMKLSKL
ncbi:E3 ubiquitin/ISG15 ligase TRIM25-like [Triplophysa dalaica]|uniref:E3 ubiquitin/ISG15 ligase TRIM25-like n=1 Tax=Triplophysa dalaica TaxID=1582913 RepID=UPI0024E00E05|nr:E3 ubiquitin/ISG15 ligase TRIM25-like [Triplophysa dalaica]